MPKSKSNQRLRIARPSDIKAIAAIDRELFSNAWNEDYFHAELQHAIAKVFVCEQARPPRIAGFMLFWLLDEEIELHKIAVHADFQRQGYAAKMMRKLLSYARRAAVKSIHLEVRAANAAACSLYAKWGFQIVGRRKQYYHNPVEDAVLYVLRLDGHMAKP